MKTTKRQFLKSILAAIPLSKIVDVEGSENKEVAKNEQRNIDKFYNAVDKDGYPYSGWGFVPEEHKGSTLINEVDVTQWPPTLL